MTKYISLVLFMLIFLACSKTKFESHDHSAGGAEEHGHGHGGGDIENLRFTMFSAQHELFAEVTPLIKDKEGQFIVHYTKLSDFKPVLKGALRIILSGAVNETVVIDTIARAGIFIASYTPKSTGLVEIAFVYSDIGIADTIKIPSQKCYSSLEEAKKDEKPEENGITFLKEESWKIDFALMQIVPSDFSESVKAIGKAINNPADEISIVANTSGVVELPDNNITLGKRISAGSKMFSIKSGSLREDNIELKYSQAKSNFERAKKEYERVSELYKSRISSERDYLEAKATFENAEAIYKNYSQSSDGKNIVIKTPKSGYLKRLLVNSGQFVEAGTLLAVIANNNKLLIQVDIPAKEYSRLSNINDANFVIDAKTYRLSELNGKLTGSPINSGSSGFVKLFFQIENKLNLMPETYITAYLFGPKLNNSITAPKGAIWEDQGNYFVFVQKHGELFEKREVTIKGFDGFNYLIGTGLNSGEVIVSKGTYRVMLASKSSELPSQTHAH